MSTMALIRILAVAVVLATAGFIPSAVAQYHLCNRTEFVIVAAVGQRVADQWWSRGWWRLLPGDCATPIARQLNDRIYAVYAETERRTTAAEPRMWAGSVALCTSAEPFEVAAGADCRTRGYEQRGFQAVDVGDRIEWTTNFSSPSGWPTLDAARIAGAQRLLTLQGYPSGSIDGVAGQRTAAAVRAFQRQHGLPVDGFVTPALLSVIAGAF